MAGAHRARMVLTIAMLSVLAQTPPPLVDAGGEVVQVEEPPARFTNMLRFGGGSFQGANAFYNGDGNLTVDVLGAYLRLGTQVNERLGFELEGAGASSGLLSTYRGALWATWMANDYVTLGLGGAVGNNSAVKLGLFSPSTTVSHDYVAVVERIDFHFIAGRTENGGRKAFTLGLELEQGPQNLGGQDSAIGFGGYLTMGYAFW